MDKDKNIEDSRRMERHIYWSQTESKYVVEIPHIQECKVAEETLDEALTNSLLAV